MKPSKYFGQDESQQLSLKSLINKCTIVFCFFLGRRNIMSACNADFFVRMDVKDG